jgi:hypothetical protein
MGGSDRTGRRAPPPIPPLPGDPPLSPGPLHGAPTTRYRLPDDTARFSSEEPPSFGSRLTPVVPPPGFPSEPGPDPFGATVASSPPAYGTPESEMAAFPLARESRSDLRVEAMEALRVESPPDPPLDLPPVRRPLGRSIVAKVLFLAIFSAAMVLLAYEISVVFHIPWLDVRWVLAQIQKR